MRFNIGAAPRKLPPEEDTLPAEDLLRACEPYIKQLLLYYCTTPQKRKVLSYWNKIEEVLMNGNLD